MKTPKKSEERGDDGGDGHAAVGADANRVVAAHVLLDAGGAEAVAARGEDAQARANQEVAVVEADGAREPEILVGLGCDLAVVLAGEGGEAGLDDGVLFGAVLVGQLVELLDLRLERVEFVGVYDGVGAVDGTLRSAAGLAGRDALALAGGLGDVAARQYLGACSWTSSFRHALGSLKRNVETWLFTICVGKYVALHIFCWKRKRGKETWKRKTWLFINGERKSQRERVGEGGNWWVKAGTRQAGLPSKREPAAGRPSRRETCLSVA